MLVQFWFDPVVNNLQAGCNSLHIGCIHASDHAYVTCVLSLTDPFSNQSVLCICTIAEQYGLDICLSLASYCCCAFEVFRFVVNWFDINDNCSFL